MTRKIWAVIALLAAISFSYRPAWSQATVGTGGIEGTVTDPQAAIVAGATVVITNKATGQVINTTSNASGAYSSGALFPGIYSVRVEAQNFKTYETSLTVVIGVISPGNVKLELGAASSVIEVTGSTVQVNTDQTAVSGTITSQQIDNLPINGRNFLDIAQLEPGVQIQDGSNFDPTKTGFSSISFGGRFGRTARIMVDGVDVSDETVGTTTTNIPASAISEFQIAQSSLDLSTELTSSGAVNVATKSGTNIIHGEAYGVFRDSSEGAALPGNGTYQRSQYGGDVGGAFIKDKLFYFLDGERTLQHSASGLIFPDPFTSFDGSFNSPYSDFEGLARLDYQITNSVRAFFRYNYFQNSLIPAFGEPSYSFFANKDRTRVFVGGVDFNTGSFTHSIRAEYLKFVNNIADAVRGSGAPLSDFPVALDFTSNGLATGPSDDAPQFTLQSDAQFKYDGSKIEGNHTIRYGVAYNHIQGGGYASFFGIAPTVFDNQFTTPSNPYNSYVGPIVTCPGGQTAESCPLNYTPDLAYIGNGLGFSSEKPAFGYKFGGQGPDNRVGLYVGDSWKVKPNLTFIYGVRYSRDTGRTDSDLNTLGAVNTYLPGFGDPVKQQNWDLGPQIGFAWDPKGSGKTVIRAGIGQYYENAIWNNALFDRPARLPSGAFLFYTPACANGTVQPVPFADGSTQFLPGGNSTCLSAIGATLPAGTSTPLLDCSGLTTASCIADFQGKFQAAATANPTSANASYLPNQIANGQALLGGDGTFNPNYKVPRSIQMNVGFQHELRPGMVLSVDYLRNVGTHYLLNIDENHTGDAAFLNLPAAQAAVSRTLGFCGVASITAALVSCPGDPLGPSDPNPYTPRPATIQDFATNGLDSNGDVAGGAQCGGGLPASYQYACAFGGINPLIGEAPFLSPVGRSVYDAMDVKWQYQAGHPFKGVNYVNFQVSYTLSQFQNTGSTSFAAAGTPAASDQDFINNALDNRNPLRYLGDSTLDRTNQTNFGGWARLPAGIQVGLIAHFWSPLAVTPSVSAAGVGAIYTSDFTGSGVVSDPLPIAQTSSTCGTVGGTCTYTNYNNGAFGRNLNGGGLANAVNKFNSTIAGSTITPAGQALINAGLFNEAQLIALGATPQAIPTVPDNQANLGWLKQFDLQLSYNHSFFNERLTLTPSVSFFNVFNFVNYDSPLNILSGGLSGTPGTINGTPGPGRTDKVGVGTGVFGLGAPRAIEWGLKLNF
jgi:Carboxypeptidase regulatory-like domain